MTDLLELSKYLESLANKKRITDYQRFFKTKKGEYGEGDVFIGVTVPKSRLVAKRYSDLSFSDIAKLLKSKIHEERLVALLTLVNQFKKADEKGRKAIYNLYLKNTKYINNWDLVDLTASKIVGEYLSDKNKEVLYKLARSNSLWERRIAIIATGCFISKGKFDQTLKISEILLNDNHDLIHKAVGWILREVGKRNQEIEEEFLKKYYKKMPRTMLRYAIEKFPDKKRKKYLKGLA